MSELNKRLHELMGRGCWHESPYVLGFPLTSDGGIARCAKCEEVTQNPAYDTDISAAMEAVEWAVREKGVGVEINGDKHGWQVDVWRKSKCLGTVCDESLPMAITKALIEALESEGECEKARDWGSADELVL